MTYFQPLKFEDGAYIFEAPTTLPKGALPQGAQLKDIVHIMTTVRGARPEPVMVECKSHPVSLVQAGPGVTQVMIDPRSNKWGNGNYLMRMPVWSPSITAAVQQPSPKGPTADTRAPFIISISPPDPKSCAPFARSVFFIVDRSGSMTGKPMAGANQALLAGLSSLGPQDTFNICAFDNLQEYLSEDMVPASPENINAAKGWIQGHCTARGTTDILSPLRAAVAILSKRPLLGAVPLIYVVTDGAVENEREICRYMQEVMDAPPPEGLMTHPRVCTFGIGRYCNHYFLKMLSQIGKGLSDAAYTDERVGSQMITLINASRTPVLTDVMLGIPGAGESSKVEVYPFPVPDLYIGAPVMVAGKIQGGLPPAMSIKGRLASGEEWESTIPVAPDLQNNVLSIPLDKVFIKERIDMLTANAWLTNNKSAEADVTALSLEYGVPCPHTKLCAFEVDPKKSAEVEAAKKKGGAMKIAKYAVGGAAGVMVLGARSQVPTLATWARRWRTSREESGIWVASSAVSTSPRASRYPTSTSACAGTCWAGCAARFVSQSRDAWGPSWSRAAAASHRWATSRGMRLARSVTSPKVPSKSSRASSIERADKCSDVCIWRGAAVAQSARMLVASSWTRLSYQRSAICTSLLQAAIGERERRVSTNVPSVAQNPHSSSRLSRSTTRGSTSPASFST